MAGTILLVDDEDIIIDVGKMALVELGYTVLTAKSGKEAVETYKSKMKEIDVVVLDFIMPDLGGEETFHRLKELNPDIKVLISSGYNIDEQVNDMLKHGCKGFVQKPFSMKILSRRLSEIMDNK